MKALILMMAAMLLAAGSAAKADYVTGREAFEEGRYATAYRELESPAENGDREAQYMLGRLYEQGRGVSQSYVEAHKWYNLAASLGHDEAAEAREALAERMTAGQVAEAQKRASAWHAGRGEAETRAKAPEPAVERYSVAKVQRLLNDMGYDAGPVDGMMGSQTRSAIRKFQLERDLPVTGEPSQSLYEAMVAARTPGRQEQAQPTAEQTRDSQQRIAEIQAELRERGYDIPLVNGKLDSDTRTAIRTYQADAGLPVTGRPDQALLAQLQSADEDQITRRLERQTVMDVQKALNARGYQAGPPDGATGPKSREAIRRFQSDNDLPVTGSVDNALLSALDIEGVEPPDEAETASAVDEEPLVLTTSLRDDFGDGDFTRSPAWTVHSGRFDVVEGALRSRVQATAESAASSGEPEDIGRAILQGVLEQALGGNQGTQATTQAEIATATNVSNIFRLRVRIAAFGERGRILIGPYQGAERDAGYRLAYSLGASPTLELLGVSSSGVRVIGSSKNVPALSGGNLHEIDWRRLQEGRMSVLVDGKTVIEAADRGFDDGFSGLSIVNIGGDYAVDLVHLETPRDFE